MASSIVRLAGFACLAGVVVGSSCPTADRGIGPGTGNVQITVAPESTAVMVGASTTLSAVAKSGSGSTLTSVTFFWSSSDTTIVKVDQTGTVSSRGIGRAQIAASAQGASGVATVVVEPAAIGTVIVTPVIATLRVNASLQLTDTAKDAEGNLLTGQAVAWFTDNAAAATVDANGLVIARAIGMAHISAAVDGKIGVATITVTAVPVASVSITPLLATLDVRQTTQLIAAPLDSVGNPLMDRTITWQSATPSVATVSATGLVTGVAPGTSVIRATSEGKIGATTVTVHPAPVSSVELSPATSSVLIGQSEKLSAQVTDANGFPIAGMVVSFSSANNAIATVNSATGVVTGVGVGTTTITGTSGGKSGKATVKVLLVPVALVVIAPASETLIIGAQVTLQATPLDSAGHPLLGRTTTWTSSAPKIASVSPAGIVHAIAVGTSIVTARIGGASAAATVIVEEVPVGSVTITPPTATLQQGQTTGLSVTVRDRTGAIVTDRPVGWVSTNTHVATVSSAGQVSALNVGAALIIASAQGVSDTATITVVPAAVGSVTVAPNPATVGVEKTVTLTATVRDGSGNVLTGRAIQWTSGSPAIATVNATGVVTGVAAGSATVSATSGGVTGTATVQVSPAPIASVTITPASSTITSAQTVQLTATVKDALGNIVSTTPTWSSAPGGRVSSSGLVTPLLGDSGTTITITAAAGGKSGTAAVHVTSPPPAPVASVTVTPNPAPVQVQSTVQLTATLKDAHGNVLTGRAVQWASGSTGIATVNASGLVTGVGAGSATVSATSGGVTGSTTVQVSAIPIASVTIAPASTTITSAQTAQLTATVKNTLGTIVSTPVPTWSSTPSGRVSSSGLVTPQAADTGTTIAVTASAGGKSGNASVNVTAPYVPVASVALAPQLDTIFASSPGNSATLTATTKSGAGVILTGRPLTWTASGSVASVGTTGVVTANNTAAGSATITATSVDGPSGNATVVVIGHVATVAVTPNPLALSVTGSGGPMTGPLAAALTDTFGSTVTRPLAWSSSDNTIATVDNTGLVTAVAAGTAQITATTPDGAAGSATAMVSP